LVCLIKIQLYNFLLYKGNTQRAFFGDLMMIRTLVDLEKGDELTVNCLPHWETYEERHHSCTKKWGFQCECRLCELDRQEPPELAKERQNLVNDCKEELKLVNVTLKIG
jgi:hypothetical protein